MNIFTQQSSILTNALSTSCMNLYCWDNSTFYSISVNWNIRFPEDSKIAKFSHFSSRFLPDLVSISASVQSLSHVWFVATPWTAARQLSLYITNCRSLPNPCPLSQWCHSNHFILSCPLLLPSVFPSIRVFSNDSALCIRWPKYWSFSFNISPSNDMV